MASLLGDIYREFGWLPRIAAPLIGRYLHITLKREEKRLSNGWTYEPKTICEKNPAALALENAADHSGIHQTPKPFVSAPAFACAKLKENV